MEDTQLLKGVLEGCVLWVIAQGETYGYAILQSLSQAGFSNMQEGTIYPILTRLEKNGYIQCRREKSALGPLRKYYRITPQGEEHLASFLESYAKLTKTTWNLLFGGREL